MPEMGVEKGYIYKLLAFLLLFLGLLFALAFSIFVAWFFFSLFRGENGSNETVTNSYQYSEYNLFKNETKHGLVKMKSRILEDDYLSYHNEATGHYVVINEFGGDRFRCTGSCYCSKPQRRYGTILTRSISLIISAISSTVALRIAKDAFQDQCVQNFAGVCAETVESEVSECSDDDDEFELPKFDPQMIYYECKGYCLLNFRIRLPSVKQAARDQFFNEKGKCEDFVLAQGIHIWCTQGEDCNLRAKIKFTELHLTDFCKEHSKVEYMRYGKHEKTMRIIYHFLTTSACVAKNTKLRDNIHCYVTLPTKGWGDSEE